MMAETRKIAAILAADVVGFSRMASADEDSTLARLRTLRSEVIDPTVASQNGRVFKRTGDGALVEFRSVVEAVRCAITIQNAMIECNAGTPADQRIVFRIGIHLGDVVEESDGDLMGDGVNIAARLEGIAEPGAICLSEDAYRQVKGRLDLAVTDLGATRLKNIADPVRVYSLQVGVPALAKLAVPAEGAAPKGRSASAAFAAAIAALLVVIAAIAWHFLGANRPAIEAAPPPRLSIVVLPFANVSGDAGQDYLADALGDGLTTYVSRIPETFVIAHNTALTYKGKPTDVKAIGKELGVRYALEGSVQPTTSRIRVNAQLIDTESGAHLWAETFDEDRGDLLQTEEDIVTRLARSLDIQLAAVESARAGRLRPENADAEDLVERCVAAFNANPDVSPDPAKNAAIFEPCEQALRLDPRNIVAMRFLAIRLSRSLLAGGGGDPAAVTARLEELASRATAITPDSSYTRMIAADLALARRHFDSAIIESERALLTNPSNMGAYFMICSNEQWVGQAAKALECVDKAMRLSPHDPYLTQFIGIKASALLVLGRDAEALTWYDRFLSLAPNNPPFLRTRAFLLANLGRDQEARDAYQHYAALPEKKIENLADYKAYLSRTYGSDPSNRAWTERAVAGLRKAGMPEE
jgi:adenylate cyclase